MIKRLIDYLYWCVQALALPFILLYLLRRGLRDRRYFEKIGERLGLLPASLVQTAPGAVWLHAVSVGEILTAVELVKRLRDSMPGVPILVSATTLAGRATAGQRLRDLADGIFFAPLDYRFAIRRVLRHLRPAVVVVLETEIWPNMYREAKRFGCGLVVVNGRISDKAIGKYLRFRWFFRRALEWPDQILAQDDVSTERYRQLGAMQVVTGGNLKYDFNPTAARPPEVVRDWLEWLAPGRIWIAASTMPPAGVGDVDEDDVVIAAFQNVSREFGDLLLVLVPRKPERFDEAERKLIAAGVPVVRRSRMSVRSELTLPGVLLLDTMGELGGMFPAADVVFMGGTLAERGGHNLLEPAAFGKPVIIGPHMENFAQIAREFEESGAVVRVPAPQALAGAVSSLLSDEQRRTAIGQRALEQAELRRGATARAVGVIARLHSDSIYQDPPPFVMQALARLWAAGSAWKRRRDWARRRTLSTPVISVGNLSMGGSGKTPFVVWLAKRLAAAGERPAILTRGYRRENSEKVTILAPGEPAETTRTGDEAQIFVREKVGPIGISSDRYLAATLIEKKYGPSLFVLDDGFQHWRLGRQCEVVLIDTLDPFGGGVFPAGRLREPESALSRADIVILTRTEEGRQYDGILRRIRRWNAQAAVFRARVSPGDWRRLSGAPTPLPEGRVGAFTGLANPDTFWRTLKAAGVDPKWRFRFPDHHRYSVDEVVRMADRADVLVTTQKDALNLPASLPVEARERIVWLDINVLIDGEAALIERIRSTLKHPPAS